MIEKITSVLIANRAEIAVRIISTLKEKNIKSISIYKENEKDLPHVKCADQSVCLGGGSLLETYLNIEKIIEIAQKNKIDAIHPGYGFLSENADFAQAVENAGILFIGPKVSDILSMGDKITSKIVAKKAGIPLIEGMNLDHFDKADSTLISKLEKIGFPLLIKATAGGGGKGMKKVERIEDFEDAFLSAKRESKNAFSNDKVFVEKYIEHPRHVEIQVLCDKHKNYNHLFDRECSIQRRHQKIIEESPCNFLKEETRKKMIDAAISLCKEIDYVGAGTVEFLVDSNQNYYFLEMNTRLQVEHPVTEMITGIDLVAAQIDIACNKEVKLKELFKRGHSIEARVYSEDPFHQFLPQIGKLKLIFQNFGANTRVDFGYDDGNEMTTEYDPMIGKIIVWGENRDQAIIKLTNLLKKFILLGVKNNISYLINVLQNADFKKGETPTSFIENHPDLLDESFDFENKKDKSPFPEELLAAIYYLPQANNVLETQNNNTEGFNLYSSSYSSLLPNWRL